jgi:hypothetical protein
MREIEAIQDWKGQDVVDVAEQKVGKLEDVWFRVDGAQAVLISVKSGLLGRKRHLVPLQGSTVTRSYVRVAFREDLRRDVGLVGADGVQRLLVAAEAQVDAVRDLEARVLARDLDLAQDGAREALGAQRVVDLEVERDGVPALALQAVALGRLERQEEVVLGELVVGALDLHDDGLAGAQGRGDARAVEALDRGADVLHPLAEAGAERPQVRLERDPAELVGVRHELERLHVQLVRDDLGEPLDRRALLARGDDDRPAQRLAHVEPGQIGRAS